MAGENRRYRGAMLALASLTVLISLAVIGATPAGAYYYDTDGDGLPDFYEIKHGMHGTTLDELSDWDGDGLGDAVEDANQNGIVDIGETDPTNPDTDGDGISDGIEGIDVDTDGDGLVDALDWDSDGDFIPDGDEDVDGDGVQDAGETDRLNADSDGDGLIDGWEAMWGTDPLDENSDDDAWNDYDEITIAGANPLVDDSDGDGRIDGVGNEGLQDSDGDGIINALDFDSDNDGLTDSQEDFNENAAVDVGETDPTAYDTDGDGFSDGYEVYEALSDPLNGEDSDGDGLYDGEELAVYKTDPNDVDTDGDGIEDGVECPHGTPVPGVDTDGDGLIDALDLDSDNDGIDDSEEIVLGVDGYVTDPQNNDTDGDGLMDNAEVHIYGTDPTTDADPGDGDGVGPWAEIHTWGTNFDMDDTDGDGLVEGLSGADDRVDVNSDGANPIPFKDMMYDALDWDSDGDGIFDDEEMVAGADGYVTDHRDWDTDGDGLADGQETHIWGTDPTLVDTDGEGINDDVEIFTLGTNPLDVDTDGDGIDDYTEQYVWMSNPLATDTDGDGIIDGSTITGTYIDAAGVEQGWSFTEDNTEAELGGDGLANVLDTDADWREWEDPPTYVYLDFNDRTELAYASYAAAKKERAFHVGPLNPGDPDTDSDGYPDAQEVACGFDPLDARDYGDCGYVPDDTDGDGLYDIEEAVLGTDFEAGDFDTDGDGLWDGDEMHPSWWNLDGFAQTRSTDPLDTDTDNDNLGDFDEVAIHLTNPGDSDTDGDGITDYYEVLRGYDPLDFDMDNDDLYDGYEDVDYDGVLDAAETDPMDPDTDGDSFEDGDELLFGTLPRDTDTDNDGLTDGLEVGYAGDGDTDTSTMTDPRNVDSDFDGLNDGVEDANANGFADATETDAQNRDTDGDGLPDYYEAFGNDPTLSGYAMGWIDNTLDATLAYDSDTDNDLLNDREEFEQEADPNVMDSDSDGFDDGVEFYTYMTDPTNTDTDNDGCDEGVGPGDVESVTVDTDGDGIINAMDVDSDNDWYWDCAGTETAVIDDDSDGVPNILDNDTDNDNLSDRQEMGIDTWHEFADNDRDFDEDGILDGDEYYHSFHQPHTGVPNFRASDPKLFDTDGDGLHDGFEVGKVSGYPVDLVYGGTNPDPGVWDLDGTPNSDVRYWDSDMDGLTDFEEDVDMDGDDLDIGLTESDPEDGDTDDDGLADGYEVKTIGTAPIDTDSDADGLMDGLEWGLIDKDADGFVNHYMTFKNWDVLGLPYPGWVNYTASVNPGPGNRYDTVDDAAYMTDPLNDDTDGDTLLDGVEDADADGNRDGNSPFDLVSDWGGIGETDPNEADTDRGGMDDGTEVGAGDDPLLYTDGDWDIDIDNNGGDAVSNVLTIGSPTVGIVPGSSGNADIVVYHTNGTNPDAADGPSTALGGIDCYVRATSFHWAGQLSGSTYTYPHADDTDWFHYTEIGFSTSTIAGFAPGASQTVTVTANVPEGAMPGWYLGYVQVETERAIEQELPDDWIEVRVYVAEHKDLDICDDDDDPLGVGLASDPLDFPEPAALGEMHLMGAPMYPGTFSGMFRVANPNTNPDGDWPYPGHTPDGVNDYNGLDALPHVWRTWDTNTLDPQGNVSLFYEIEAQYEWSSVGPQDPTAAISFDSPLKADFAFATIDSHHVTIDTTTLPYGTYEGVVRVFEDIPHGVIGPNGVWDGDEVFDTFVLKFALVMPDLDIDDNYANMDGNEITLDVNPGDADVMVGEIRLVNASGTTNIDDWDGPATESLYDFWYFDPSDSSFTLIPTTPNTPPDNVTAMSFPVVNGEGDAINVWLDGVMGDTLTIGEAKKLRLWIREVAADLPAGIYTTDHPAEWVPGDGTVPIASRGLDTGMGFVMGEFGPSVVYDPAIPMTSVLMDYFFLTVNVAEVIDVEFASPLMALSGHAGTAICGVDTVNNIGNTQVEDVHFEVDNLLGQTHGGVILSSAIDFDPATMVIPYGAGGEVEICVAVPAGTEEDTYVGTIHVLADGETYFDEMTLNVTVLCDSEIDVAEGAYGVSGNVMTLAPDAGASAEKQFELCNTGNCDVTGLDWSVTGLPAGLSADITMPSADLDYGDCFLGTLEVTWTDPALGAGTYSATVEVTADGGLSDTFTLEVVVAALWAAEFDDPAFELVTDPGATICDEIAVWNIGNQTLADMHFEVTNLLGDLEDYFIPSSSIDFDPLSMSLVAGAYEDLEICATIPANWRADTYTGTVSLLANGEELFDELELDVVVNEIPAMDVLDNAYNIVGNIMTLAPEPGQSAVGEFQINNTGNCDLSAIDYATVTLPDDLVDGVTVDITVPAAISWQGVAMGEVEVTWLDPEVPAGVYTMPVTIEGDGSIADNFTLQITIAELPGAAFVDDALDADGIAGEIASIHFYVENIGNVDLESGMIALVMDDLVGATGSRIESEDVTFDPATAAIPDNGEYEFTAHIAVPEGLLGQDYIGDLAVLVDGEPMDEIPVTITLERGDAIAIYPNPYRMSEHEGGITIALGSEADAVMVYDMFGVLVADLTEEVETGDRNADVPWDLLNDDGKTVATGMYIVTIETGDEVVTRKIMVIK